jgi:metallo-beta-lactamase class B
VGIEWVRAWVLETSEGLILFDSLYGPFIEGLLKNIESVGFDPMDIKYILVSHVHSDHVGGAKALQDLTGARIGMVEGDWEMLEADAKAGRLSHDAIPRDLVIQDGDVVTLGDTSITCYATPGHTPGVLSMAFTVYDNGEPHQAFSFGGVGLNFSGVARTEMYIESVKRLQAMQGIEVSIPNHASMGRVFERNEELKNRKPGEAHPFVDPEGFSEWLGELMVNVEKKLEEEKAGR